MFTRLKLIVSFAVVLYAVPAGAGTLVYGINESNQFGTLDISSGKFSQIGPDMLEAGGELVAGPNGSLLTLAISGNLESINPATGATAIIGATGLDDCTAPGSPCGPTSAAVLSEIGGTIYATDLSNNLYTVNPATGAATMKGPTGVPPLPFRLLDINPDGSQNAFDETLFVAGGSLYETFDAITIDFSSFTFTPVIPAALYRIDPATGLATLVGPTALNLNGAVNVNGTVYADNAATNQMVTIDPANGHTSVVSDLDPAVGLLSGASPTPEPASLALAGIGIAALVVFGRRRRQLS
jgi:PEP-CTERM motif